jgi:hypothetical protein
LTLETCWRTDSRNLTKMAKSLLKNSSPYCRSFIGNLPTRLSGTVFGAVPNAKRPAVSLTAVCLVTARNIDVLTRLRLKNRYVAPRLDDVCSLIAQCIHVICYNFLCTTVDTLPDCYFPQTVCYFIWSKHPAKPNALHEVLLHVRPVTDHFPLRWTLRESS